jgi:hypothetical protein
MAKEEEYKSYIRSHRENVKNAFTFWRRTDDAQNLFGGEGLENMESLIGNHDLSKYSTEEFDAYRKNFFPYENEVSDESAFSDAVLHHYNHNPHHWEYWVIPRNPENELIPIPMRFLVEMLCDWTAMSFQKGGSVISWFEENQEEMVLHSETKESIRYLLPGFQYVLELMRVKG